jgi:Uma2 family endonuclease
MHAVLEANPPASSVRPAPGVRAYDDDWVLSEEDMPESSPHRDAVDLLRQIVLSSMARKRPGALVAANLGCRWDRAHPQVGVDPDIALIEPPPPEGQHVECLCTWREGHVPPRFAIEVVSRRNAPKDYVDAPAKYACLGTRELVVFDPHRLGPTGSVEVLQVWRLDAGARSMTKVYAGDGPARSEELGAWLIAMPERALRIADDPEGRSLWPTDAETERAARRKAEESLGDALRGAVEDICEVCGVPLDEARRARLAALGPVELEALRASIKRERAWPSGQ